MDFVEYFLYHVEFHLIGDFPEKDFTSFCNCQAQAQLNSTSTQTKAEYGLISTLIQPPATQPDHFRQGQAKKDPVRSGHVKSGQVNSGQTKSGQVKLGKVKSA